MVPVLMYASYQKEICQCILCDFMYYIKLLILLTTFCREGSVRGFGIRVSHSAQGSDSWVDDPITRHIITLYSNRDDGDKFSLWPLVLHIKGGYCILVLPLVEPHQYKAYERMCWRSDCGSSVGEEDGLSFLLLNLPCITGYGKFCMS